MFSRRLKTGYFALEGLNSFATVYYFYYLYFFMQKAYGFGNQANLMLAALNGATYALMAWFGGRFAQRYGYFTALKMGYAIMIGALSLGLAVRSAGGHVGVMVLIVVGMSFTWPTLEALVSEGEARTGLQHMVGVYNVVWAATAAIANFSGGAMLEKLGLASLFYVPILVHVIQLGLTLWLQSKATARLRSAAASEAPFDSRAVALGPEVGGISEIAAAGPTKIGTPNGRPFVDTRRAEVATVNQIEITASNSAQASMFLTALQANSGTALKSPAYVPTSNTPDLEHPVAIPKAKRFLRMAWLANPFAYIAINTLIAVVPGVARRLELSTMAAGFCCSTWCFARLGAFAALWRWTGWHYRFRWLLLAYLALVGSFGAVVLAPSVAVLILAQLVFGGAVGLIYYSSLFYSMDRSETKGEHGGIHEAVIGLGNCAGPAVGAAALQLAPQYSQSGTVAVIALLLCGLGGLVGIWRRKSVGEPINERMKNENEGDFD
jgi:predicted MFS family arabinose efflux permease